MRCASSIVGDSLPAGLRGGFKADRNLVAWVTVHVPRGAPAGKIGKVASLIRKIAPNLPIMQTGRPHRNLLDASGIWMLHSDAWGRNTDFIDAARKRGQKVGLYHNTIAMIDYSPMRVRTFAWGLWKERVDLVGAWWSLNNWSNNPWEEPMNGGGGRRNGDGVLFYPPRGGDEHGPITSARWEIFRESLEDYDYLTILAELAEAKKDAAENARRLLAEAGKVLPEMPPVRQTKDGPYSLTPDTFLALRRQIAEEIVKLKAKTIAL